MILNAHIRTVVYKQFYFTLHIFKFLKILYIVYSNKISHLKLLIVIINSITYKSSKSFCLITEFEFEFKKTPYARIKFQSLKYHDFQKYTENSAEVTKQGDLFTSFVNF